MIVQESRPHKNWPFLENLNLLFFYERKQLDIQFLDYVDVL